MLTKVESGGSSQTRDLLHLLAKSEEQRLKRFIYQSMDVARMEAKTKNRKYRYLEQFEADAQTIQHNILICFGRKCAPFLFKKYIII